MMGTKKISLFCGAFLMSALMYAQTTTTKSNHETQKTSTTTTTTTTTTTPNTTVVKRKIVKMSPSRINTMNKSSVQENKSTPKTDAIKQDDEKSPN